MNPHDCDDVFSQFVYFIFKCRELIRLLQSKTENKLVINSVVEELNEIISKYYMNLNLCPSCGHPIPSLPSVLLRDKISHIMADFIDTYELKTGEEFPDLFLSPSNFERESDAVKDSPRLILPPRLASVGKQNNIHVIKATLL